MTDSPASLAMDSAAAPRFFAREEPHAEKGTLLGFWIYLMSDCLIFAVLFSCYAVLGRNTAGGPTAAEALDLTGVAVNTAMLLLSSIAYGFGMLEMARQRQKAMLFWLAVAASTGAVLFNAAVLRGSGAESPLYGIAHPIGALLFSWIAIRSMVVTLWRGGIIWRDTFYPLDELRRGSV